MNNKISIIIPVYNVEKYIKKCIDSLKRQTYSNFEAIFVNDGSTDSSIDIVENNNDERFIIVSKENGGLSSARNYGLKYVSGDYLMFLDSDDYLPDFSLEILMSEMLKYDVDFVQGSIEYVFPNFEKKVILKEEIFYENIVKKYFDNDITIIPVWNKLYKIDLVKDIFFKEGYNFEDIIYTFQIFSHANSFFNTDKIVYYYVQREDSIMNEKDKTKKMKVLDSMDEIINLSKNNNYDSIIFEMCVFKKYISMVYLILNYNDLITNKTFISQLKKIKKFFKFNDVFDLVNKKDLVIYSLSCFSMRLLIKIYSLFKKKRI